MNGVPASSSGASGPGEDEGRLLRLRRTALVVRNVAIGVTAFTVLTWLLFSFDQSDVLRLTYNAAPRKITFEHAGSYTAFHERRPWVVGSVTPKLGLSIVAPNGDPVPVDVYTDQLRGRKYRSQFTFAIETPGEYTVRAWSSSDDPRDSMTIYKSLLTTIVRWWPSTLPATILFLVAGVIYLKAERWPRRA
jgi:hypothetical protein